jgi:ribonuclease BN (tRNA processing enzyme)
MTGHMLQAYREDIRERLDGLEPANATGCHIDAHEIEPGQVYQDGLVSVEAVPARHGAWPAFGYRFHTADRTIVISGDTAPADAILDAAHGCDLLLHEVYSTEGFLRHEPEWQAYHSEVHTSSQELARIASKAQPGLLVLYHQLFWGVSDEELLNEVRSSYAGRVVSGRDLGIY